MSFGEAADEEASAAMFRRCRDLGINFFDSAINYAGGRSEEILGRLISDCRNEIVLISKVGLPVGKEKKVNSQGLSRRHIMMSVETSLKRLRTDRLDIYFAHRFDPLPDGIEVWNSKYDGRYAPRPGTFEMLARTKVRRPDVRAFYGQDLHWIPPAPAGPAGLECTNPSTAWRSGTPGSRGSVCSSSSSPGG
jgi:aryl-alcohol dehydrogenase-like predicted oxidoreductase